MLFPWSFVIELCCLLFAILFIGKGRRVGYWHTFLWYMLFVVIVEGYGWSLWFVFKQKNHWLYNIELPVTFYFLFWFYKKQFEEFNVNPLWGKVIAVLFAFFFMFESFKTRFVEYNRWAAVLRAVLLLMASVVYFYLFLKRTEYVSLYKHPPFLIIASVFFFYFASTVASLFVAELSTIYLMGGVPLRHILFTFLNFCLYSSWAYTFRCRYLQTI
jgi:hypothetical protein